VVVSLCEERLLSLSVSRERSVNDQWAASAQTPGSTVVGPMTGSCCPMFYPAVPSNGEWEKMLFNPDGRSAWGCTPAGGHLSGRITVVWFPTAGTKVGLLWATILRGSSTPAAHEHLENTRIVSLDLSR